MKKYIIKEYNDRFSIFSKEKTNLLHYLKYIFSLNYFKLPTEEHIATLELHYMDSKEDAYKTCLEVIEFHKIKDKELKEKSKIIKTHIVK